MSESENQKEILLNEIKERKDNLVIFAGAGIPTATGIPAWEDLLIGLAKELKDEKLEQSIKRSNGSEYHKRAQEAYEKFIEKENNIKKKGEERYYSAIRELLTTKDWDYGPSQLCIWHACKKIVTTNFDSTFKDAHDDYYLFRDEDKSNLDPQCFPDLSHKDFWEKDKNLVYLHGNTARKVIFKEDDYDTFYLSGDDTLRDFYKTLYRDKVLLFIGFSFDDKYILDMLRSIHRKLLRQDKNRRYFDENSIKGQLDGIQHYAFIKDKSYKCEQEIEQLKRAPTESIEDYTKKECEMNEKVKEIKIEKKKKEMKDFEKLCEDLRSIKIMPLKYKNHKDYRHWLNQIAAYRPKTVSDIADDPGSDSAFKQLNRGGYERF